MKIAMMLVALAAATAAPVAAQVPPGAPPGSMASFPNRNGPLSAMIAIIPAQQIEEFDKPADQPPHINPVAVAKVGDAVAIKILFSGPAFDAAGGMDTTYDLQIIAPDGSFYSGVNQTGIEAVKVSSGGRPGMEKGVFDNRAQTVAIGFEPQDQAGVYKVRAVLHDKIGKRDVPLAAQIELKK